MIKTFLKSYKIEILEAYIVGMVCFICMSTMSMSWIGMAIMIGLANTYLVSPVVKALKLGNVADHDIMQIKHRIFIKNEIKAIGICSILVIGYFVVDTYFFSTGVEPITFGIFYKLLDEGMKKIGTYVKQASRV